MAKRTTPKYVWIRKDGNLYIIARTEYRLAPGWGGVWVCAKDFEAITGVHLEPFSKPVRCRVGTWETVKPQEQAE